jgi:sulfur relay (sulfurtransferase) DsrC/TusE family protein
MNKLDFLIGFMLLTLLALLLISPFYFYVLWVKRKSRFIKREELKNKTASKILDLNNYSLDELIELSSQLQSRLESSKIRFEESKIGGAFTLINRMSADTGAYIRYQRDLLTYADAYNEYMELHEYHIAVNRLIRAHQERWTKVESATTDNSPNEQLLVKSISQEKCRKACEKRKLQKYVTIPPHVKYEIAKEIGIDNVGSLEDFKSGQSAYQVVSKMMSVAGYSKKKEGIK